MNSSMTYIGGQPNADNHFMINWGELSLQEKTSKFSVTGSRERQNSGFIFF
jgi:hypothetical protein